GVAPYIAPEIVKEKFYTKAADIYSLGIVMNEIYSGEPPFKGCQYYERLLLDIANGKHLMIDKRMPCMLKNLKLN
ncbi:hypothetical protein C2G38_1948888, partial [Gigaspora rosea]